MMTYAHEGDKKIQTTEEAGKWIDRQWELISKPDWLQKQIKTHCEIAGGVLAFIVMPVFGRQLPAWLFEGARGNNLLMEAGMLLGAGVDFARCV